MHTIILKNDTLLTGVSFYRHFIFGADDNVIAFSSGPHGITHNTHMTMSHEDAELMIFWAVDEGYEVFIDSRLCDKPVETDMW